MVGTKQLDLLMISEDDVDELTNIMKLAFDFDSRLHTGQDGGPPGYDNGDFIRTWCFHKDTTAYKIILEGRTIGAVILFINEENHHNTLGCIFIDPDMRGKGIGVKVWKLVEHTYPQTQCWKTETIWYSKYNHYFYVEKCGFKIVGIDNPYNNPQAQYRMEKTMF